MQIFKVSKKSHSQADTITLRLQKGSLRNNTIQYLFQAASCVHFVNLPKSTKKNTTTLTTPRLFLPKSAILGVFPQSSALERGANPDETRIPIGPCLEIEELFVPDMVHGESPASPREHQQDPRLSSKKTTKIFEWPRCV